MKIKVSHEAPISILPWMSERIDYEYALVHLFETHPEYYKHFETSLVRNREVLLDNSIFELKKAFDAKKFVTWIDNLHPTYYIIPDVLDDGYNTVLQCVNFKKEFKDLPGRSIGVVHGKTYDEIVDCYKYMADNVDYIAINFQKSLFIATGIGKTELERQCTGRQNLVRNLIDDGVWEWTKPHHLLGASLAKEFKYYITNDIHNIRSCDTSNPVVAGILGHSYAGDLGLNFKPSQLLAEMIDHQVSKEELSLIDYNVSAFRSIVS